MIYALNLKNFTKYTNYIMQNKKIKKNIGKKNLKPKFKIFELQRFIHKKKTNVKKPCKKHVSSPTFGASSLNQ
jgi:hypothetical protein